MRRVALALMIVLAFSCKKKKAEPDSALRWYGTDDARVTCGTEHDGVYTCLSNDRIFVCVQHAQTSPDGCSSHPDYMQCVPAAAPAVAPPASR